MLKEFVDGKPTVSNLNPTLLMGYGTKNRATLLSTVSGKRKLMFKKEKEK